MRAFIAFFVAVSLLAPAARANPPSPEEAFKTTTTGDLWGYYVGAAGRAYGASVKCDGGYYAFSQFSFMVENFLTTPKSRIAAWELFRRDAWLDVHDKCDQEANDNAKKDFLEISIALMSRMKSDS